MAVELRRKEVDKLALLRALKRRLGEDPDKIIPKKVDQQIDGCIDRLQERFLKEPAKCN